MLLKMIVLAVSKFKIDMCKFYFGGFGDMHVGK